MTAREKEALHRLIDDLPVSELSTIRRVLEGLHAVADPVSWALQNAPDDEPLSVEDETAIAEGEKAQREGKLISDEKARRQLLDS